MTKRGIVYSTAHAYIYTSRNILRGDSHRIKSTCTVRVSVIQSCKQIWTQSHLISIQKYTCQPTSPSLLSCFYSPCLLYCNVRGGGLPISLFLHPRAVTPSINQSIYIYICRSLRTGCIHHGPHGSPPPRRHIDRPPPNDTQFKNFVILSIIVFLSSKGAGSGHSRHQMKSHGSGTRARARAMHQTGHTITIPCTVSRNHDDEKQ